MKDDWVEKFITYAVGWYIAWDETQANELGRFRSYGEAKAAVLEYAETLRKKEPKMDFKVGDKVVCLLNGTGIVFDICGDGSIYSVVVEFDNEYFESYTTEGKLDEDNKFPCLFHEGTEINIKPAEPKQYPWVNIYVREDGECISGISLSTRELALKNVGITGGKYVDTIQLKPKGEEK
jgi:hypothetical protein